EAQADCETALTGCYDNVTTTTAEPTTTSPPTTTTTTTSTTTTTPEPWWCRTESLEDPCEPAFQSCQQMSYQEAVDYTAGTICGDRFDTLEACQQACNPTTTTSTTTTPEPWWCFDLFGTCTCAQEADDGSGHPVAGDLCPSALPAGPFDSEAECAAACDASNSTTSTSTTLEPCSQRPCTIMNFPESGIGGAPYRWQQVANGSEVVCTATVGLTSCVRCCVLVPGLGVRCAGASGVGEESFGFVQYHGACSPS